jgi:hypothetical protein
MNLRRNTALLTFIGVFTCSGLGFGQPATEKPNWKIGDHWKFQRVITEQGIGDDKHDTLSRKIVAFLPNHRLQVQYGNGTIAQFDGAMNFTFVGDGGAEQVKALGQFPLKVGAEWTYTTKSGPMQGARNGSAKIVSYESATVPAGTFFCYRIDVIENYGNKDYSEVLRISRWYCPAVKWIVRQREEKTISVASRGGAQTTVSVLELVKFTPGE